MTASLLVTAAFAVPSLIQTYPLELRFAENETLKYREAIEVTESTSAGGQTQSMKAEGSRTINIKVTSIDGNKASMSFAYSNVTGKAKASGLPPNAPKAEVAKMEQEYAERFKNDLGSGERTQMVDPKGNTVYKFILDDVRTVWVYKGAFLALALPDHAPKMNEKWTLKLAQPDPTTSALFDFTFKLVGALPREGETAYRIVISGSTSNTQKQNGMTMKQSLEVSGWVLLGGTSGKILGAEITSTSTQSLTHPQQGTRKAVNKTVRKLEKID
ncbi:MAG: hypothetical protein AKCLJLPJ_00257 [Fimbriimonadales bacterium]|nr:MAG: hypothetical protein EDM73_01235 [Armatimonadota bacterium]MBV6502214.1 hypothetical protein [Fimbriimonadales bacterium]MCE7899051.1 hypothetical protein [Armatimonadetes bacterium ATM1]MDL1927506.1 hypothetical protein [Fimbriimonadia bacterium ATM]MBC6969783.1 hypothetical protein [Armatimonadota bacterium]